MATTLPTRKRAQMFTIVMLTYAVLATLAVIGLCVVVVPRLIYVAAHRFARTHPRARG